MTEPVTVYLGIGSNLGDRAANLDRAIELLSQRMKVDRVSSVYDTDPLDPSQPRFLNIVCQVTTRLTPEGLLTLAKGVESKLGRIGRPASRGLLILISSFTVTWSRIHLNWLYRIPGCWKGPLCWCPSRRLPRT